MSLVEHQGEASRGTYPAFGTGRSDDLHLPPRTLCTPVGNLGIPHQLREHWGRESLGEPGDIVATEDKALLAEVSPEVAEESSGLEGHEAIVVGAGSAGLAAAFALSRRGFETIVIEVESR